MKIKKEASLVFVVAMSILMSGCLGAPTDGGQAKSPKELSWLEACDQAWDNYTVETIGPDKAPPSHPPEVDGSPCNVISMDSGELVFAQLGSDAYHGNSFEEATPIINANGSYDWVGMDLESNFLKVWENETKEFRLIDNEVDFDRLRQISGVRLDNGEIHVVVHGSTNIIPGQSARGIREFIHYWWEPDKQVQKERLGWNDFIIVPRLATDGSVVVLADPGDESIGGGASRVLWTESGNLEERLVPAMEVQYAVPHDGDIFACGTYRGGVYLLQESNDWEPEIVTTDASLLQTICEITITSKGPLITFVGLPLIGDSPERDEYRIAVKEEEEWEITPLGMHMHSGADLTSYNGVPYHIHTTGGQPGPDGESTDGNEIRTPSDESFDGRWEKIWGGQGGSHYFLDSPSQLAVASTWWRTGPIDGRDEVTFYFGVLHLDYNSPALEIENIN